MAELKNCPFCGGKATVAFIGRKNYYNGSIKGFITVKCWFCEARVKGAFYHGEEIRIPLELTIGAEEASEAWNRRAGVGNG